MPAPKQELEIEGKKVKLSNLQKALYPQAGFTKAQVIDYYARISPYLLPHFANRPVTLKRFPDGVGGQAFYEKDEPKFAPDWIQTFPVPRRAGGTPIRYILVNDAATLIWCANAASLELHPFLHRAPEIDTPTAMVFDLDPGEGMDLRNCAEVAFQVREELQQSGLECFPKLSGSKGLQLYAPLNTPVTYEQTSAFAKKLAEDMAARYPDQIVAQMAKGLRSHKIFIDWSQNSDFKTTVGVYSLRAKIGVPFVSMPVKWEELENLKKGGLRFTPEQALRRVEELGDLFEPVLNLKQNFPCACDKLKTYAANRDFSKNAERTPRRPSKQGSRKRFVIQKHAASHLHYDFRLEMHDVLKSWAVPKGLPLSADSKRLAMATEDHPITYLEFEGNIPKSQYGGGTVMVWDVGTYEVVEGNYYKGDLLIYLTGQKLEGEWRLRRDEADKWRILKEGDSVAEPKDVSALSGRTMEQIAADASAIWHSNRTEISGIELDTLPKSAMKFVSPMQGLLSEELPDRSGWQYEVKLDGYRALAIKQDGEVRLLSRRNKSYNVKFSAVVRALEQMEEGLISDGEVVALDKDGRPSLNVLKHYREGHGPIAFYLFDLLAYRGRDVTGLPLHQRRKLLESVVPQNDPVLRISAALDAEPAAVLDAAREHGFKAVTAKRLDSRYEAGQRSGAWVKVKVNAG